MKRLLALSVVVAVVAGTVALVGQIDRGREFRRMLASGESELESGNGYKAIESFSGALALRPDSMLAYYRRGEAYRAQRLYNQAISDWQDASRLAPGAPQPLIALGEVYSVRGEPGLAAERYADAAELLQDEDPDLLYSLALARYRSGSPAAAVDPLQRALARNDSIAEAHYLLGLVYRDTHDAAGAIASLERAINMEPELTAAREELAHLYRSEGRTDDEFLQLQSLEIVDSGVDRQIAIALAQARRGEYAVALTALRDTDPETPGDARVRLAEGRVHLMRAERTGDPLWAERAREALEAALDGTARRSEGLALLGRAAHLSGDYPAAEAILREAVTAIPIHPAAFTYLADTAERLAHDLIARDALLNLDLLEANTAPVDRRANRDRRIGALSLAGGDGSAAVHYLGRAVDAGRNDASTLALLAGAHWDTGRQAEARRWLARAVSRDPENVDVVRWSMTIK